MNICTIYKVHINYNSCPVNIKNSKKLKSRINRLFGGTKYNGVKLNKTHDEEILESQAYFLYELLMEYINTQEVNRHPDIENLHIIKNQKKLKNYMEHTLDINISNELFSYILRLF